MYSYIYGKIESVESSHIVVDNNGIGYLVYVPNPYAFKEGEMTKVYVYQHIREDEMSFFGFKTLGEKELFLQLINVKGLGPRMALPILAMGSIGGIVDAINRENLLYLKKFPKIGDKLAKQIVLDLKGKIQTSETVVVNETDEVYLDADGKPFRPDMIVVDGATLLYVAKQQSIVEFSKKRLKERLPEFLDLLRREGREL